MKIGDQIAFYRKGKGMTQLQLAKLVGVARITIALIESGARNGSLPVIKRIAEVLDCTLNYNLSKNKKI